MAVIFRSKGESPGASSTSCVIAKPAGLAVGDLMIAHILHRGGETGPPTPPEVSWTQFQHNHSGFTPGRASTLFWKIADQDDVDAASFTFTVENEVNLGAISAWYGHESTTPINASNGQHNASSTTVTSLEITPSVANCMILMYCAVWNDNTHSNYAIATNNPASWDERYDFLTIEGTDGAIAMGSALRPETSATGNGTATSSASVISVGQLVAIAPLTGTDWTKSLSDSFVISDSLVKGIGQAQTDSLTLADSSALVVEFNKTFTDSVALADALVKDVAIEESDTLNIADALSKTIGLTEADVMVLADAFSKVSAFSKSFADTMTITDALADITEFYLNLVDSVSIADSFAKVSEFNKTLIDTLTIIDSLSRICEFYRTIADTLTIKDVVDLVQGKTPNHPIPLRDQIPMFKGTGRGYKPDFTRWGSYSPSQAKRK